MQQIGSYKSKLDIMLMALNFIFIKYVARKCRKKREDGIKKYCQPAFSDALDGFKQKYR